MDVQVHIILACILFMNQNIIFAIFFLCSERFLVAISKSDSTQKVNQPQKIENSACVFTVSMHSICFKVQIVNPCTFKILAKIFTLLTLLLQLLQFYFRIFFICSCSFHAITVYVTVWIINRCIIYLFKFHTLYEFRFSDWLICTMWYWVVTKQPPWRHYRGVIAMV